MSLHVFDLLRDAAVGFLLPTAVGLAGSMPVSQPRDPGFPVAQTVQVRAGAMMFAEPGEFLSGKQPVAAPKTRVAFDGGVEIMKYQVSLIDYGRCVDAGACRPAGPTPSATRGVPVTGVNYLDAQAYAEWYSQQTGETWRLPTDAEWAYVAAERFAGDEFSAYDPKNPAAAWIRRYRAEAERKRAPDPQPKTQGHYGANSNGVFDLAGNVWEWTSTCYVRTTLSAAGAVERAIDNCGVRVVEGRHRAYMSNFIRDGKSGGCATGTPPENLGFRLAREPAPAIS